MEAAEAKVQKIIEGNKQFLIPHYQRPYSWEAPQWNTLWRDILELVEDSEAKPHFLGSIVTSPARSVPEGVEKRLVIDGQQRLTTLLVLLIAIRDRCRGGSAGKVAERIQDLLTNRHEEGLELFKLLPTQSEDPNDSDREAFVRLVHEPPNGSGTNGIQAAYTWFIKKLRRADAPDPDALHRAVTARLTLVSIILDEKDNPHRIFESLNGKGRPLSQADLIRNYFFMRLSLNEHERVYRDLWRPMQRRLGEDALTDFIRHYLIRFVGSVRESDVYAALKGRIDEGSVKPIEHLEELARYSEYYEVLLAPEKAQSQAIRERLARIRRLQVTVTYPFLLPVYGDFVRAELDEAALRTILDVIESFVIRRHVCGVPTHGMNKIFAPLYEQARKGSDFVASVKRLLSASPRLCPRDSEFRTHLSTARLYGAGERREKAKLILERLESASGHKEPVVPDALTIEHVMPQTLTEVWKEGLGPEWEDAHSQLLHTLGNLTLTSYNGELGNASFRDKKPTFAASHLELNRYFDSVQDWTAETIEQRAQALTDLAIAAWPYFGPDQETDAVAHEVDDVSVAGTVPTSVHIRGEDRPVQSWVDVAVVTMEAIVAMGDEELDKVVDELPKFVNTDATAFRRSSRLRKLSNGAYVETNLSATSIYRQCLQAAEIVGLVTDDWSVSYRNAAGDTDDEQDESASNTSLRDVQHAFWSQAREELIATGAFPYLGPAPRSHRFQIGLGRSGIYLILVVGSQQSRLAIKVVFRSEKAVGAYERIAAERAAIESEIGATFEWDTTPHQHRKRIEFVRPFRLHDSATWSEGIAWLVEYAPKFYRAFKPRVLALEL